MTGLKDKLTRFQHNKLLGTVFLTFIIELTTMFFRFGLGLQSTVHTASTIGKLTFGIRIHHGYLGLLMLLAFLFSSRIKRLRYSGLWLIIGLSLLISDAIHHSLLYLLTGSSDFDLVYPGASN